MTYTPNDERLLAKCGWMEGRDKGLESICAVMHVVINRMVVPGFPKNIRDVIMQKNAFSWTRPDNPEYGLDPADSKGLDLKMWYEALQLADTILYSVDADPTGGAHYYEAPSATSGWFARVIAGPDLMGTPGHEFTVEIGGQRYYK